MTEMAPATSTSGVFSPNLLNDLFFAIDELYIFSYRKFCDWIV